MPLKIVTIDGSDAFKREIDIDGSGCLGSDALFRCLVPMPCSDAFKKRVTKKKKSQPSFFFFVNIDRYRWFLLPWFRCLGSDAFKKRVTIDIYI